MDGPNGSNSVHDGAPSTSNTGPSEPFPSLSRPSSSQSPEQPASSNEASSGLSRKDYVLSRVRKASKTFEFSNPPAGLSTTLLPNSQTISIPSVADIREGSFDTEGWSRKGQVLGRERRASITNARGPQTDSTQGSVSTDAHTAGLSQSVDNQIRHETLTETTEEGESGALIAEPLVESFADAVNNDQPRDKTEDAGSGVPNPQSSNAAKDNFKTSPFENGYQFPPRKSWQETTVIFLKASWKFTLTPIGFLVVIYGLNVVAWGGMLFLLLCNASPYMCVPSCNDIQSPRRIWIEIDSQILNALFCVTGFGTIPWRFRDLYFLLQYRLQKKELGLRRLAGINNNWFRLAGSQELPINIGPAEASEHCDISPSCLPFPISKTPPAPLTGVRAPATPIWKLDFVVWAMVWNTFLQCVLSGLMWGYNRYDRPSWSTGLFVALACMVAGAGGYMGFIEAKKVKAIEGIPLSEADRETLEHDRELGIYHYNNIKDKGPKEPKEKKSLRERIVLKKPSAPGKSVVVEENAVHVQ